MLFMNKLLFCNQVVTFSILIFLKIKFTRKKLKICSYNLFPPSPSTAVGFLVFEICLTAKETNPAVIQILAKLPTPSNAKTPVRQPTSVTAKTTFGVPTAMSSMHVKAARVPMVALAWIWDLASMLAIARMSIIQIQTVRLRENAKMDLKKMSMMCVNVKGQRSCIKENGVIFQLVLMKEGMHLKLKLVIVHLVSMASIAKNFLEDLTDLLTVAVNQTHAKITGIVIQRLKMLLIVTVE